MPSLYLEHKLRSAVKTLCRAHRQTRVDGCENVWVRKPSFSSRGIGVCCLNSLKEALTRGNKNQAEVMQKYIERPYLLRLPGPEGRLEARKFDIRQWVLVTSMCPLTIYMFNSCYLKICGSEYKLSDIKDKYRHVSNYSVQKGNTRVNDVRNDLVMSQSQLVAHVKEQDNMYRSCSSSRNLQWHSELFPTLAKIVKDTISAGADLGEPRCHSFELFGFDFVLDYKLDPWLIEVNLSPACCERTPWLVDMLGSL